MSGCMMQVWLVIYMTPFCIASLICSTILQARTSPCSGRGICRARSDTGLPDTQKVADGASLLLHTLWSALRNVRV